MFRFCAVWHIFFKRTYKREHVIRFLAVFLALLLSSGIGFAQGLTRVVAGYSAKGFISNIFS